MTTDKMRDSMEQMRAEFEAWMRLNGFNYSDPADREQWHNMRTAWENAWQAATRRALPDGCVAVPVEATRAMAEAGRGERQLLTRAEAAECYAAMIAARPGAE